MDKLAIVAIPPKDHRIWNISSQKVPHLTLLFLGDHKEDPGIAQMLSFLEHTVATSVERFGLSVDRRGELGPNKADVLFFDNYMKKRLQEIRGYLLTNPSISKAYLSTEQHPEWLPHLTLGYPDSPAKKPVEDWEVSFVPFEKIALWTGNFEGPEFLLKGNSEELVMTDDVGKFLAHYGIKGMKWGVRRDTPSTFNSRAPGQQVIKLKNGNTLTISKRPTPAVLKVLSKVSPGIKQKMETGANFALKDSTGKEIGDLQIFKESPTALNVLWIGVDKSARGQGYAQGAMNAAVGFAKKEKFQKVTLEVPTNSPDARHIYEKQGFKAKGEVEDPGDHWGGLTRMELDLKHSSVDDILQHYGILGMKWGRRRSKQELAEASEDFQRSEAAREKIKSGGTKTLTNKELQDVVTRMNLEKQYGQLKKDEPTKFKTGHSIVQSLVKVARTAEQVHSVVNGPIGKEVIKLLK